MLYLQDSGVSLRELRNYPVPDACPWASEVASSHWKPVSHFDLATTVIDEAAAVGLEPTEHLWDVKGDGHDLFGAVDFRTRGGRLPQGTVLSIGVRHSNMGRYAVSLAFGARVTVCSNGLFIGEHIVSRKHTKGLVLGPAVREGLHEYLESLSEVRAFVRRLKRQQLDDTAVTSLLMWAGREKVLAFSAIGQVDAEWRSALHQRAFKRRNAWGLYNAFTEIVKRKSAPVQFNALRGLTELFSPEILNNAVHGGQR